MIETSTAGTPGGERSRRPRIRRAGRRRVGCAGPAVEPIDRRHRRVLDVVDGAQRARQKRATATDALGLKQPDRGVRQGIAIGVTDTFGGCRNASFNAVLAAAAARGRLDEQITEVAASPRFADAVNRLGCLRGISALTGLALTVEIGEWSRFTGSSIGAYVGLVPSEHSSGGSRVQGSITKAGNTHVRRLLIESAWHHRKSYSLSGPALRTRWAKVDPALRARGHAGNRRLNKRWQTFTERGKNPLVANVAIARELAGWCWSLATMQ